MAPAIRRRSLGRILLLLLAGLGFRLLFSSTSLFTSTTASSLYGSGLNFYARDPSEIQKQGVLDLVTRGEKALDARKHKFLQVRMGRDERSDLFSDLVEDGVADYWDRFQKPLCVALVQFGYSEPRGC